MSIMIMKIVRISILFMLCGCVRTHYTDDIVVPKPPELHMRDVQWEVISVKTINTDSKSYMCLDSHNYTNLSLNVQDLKLYMIYQNKVIELKGRYYE